MRLAAYTIGLLCCLTSKAEDSPPLARFGTTVVLPSGLQGRIYNIRHWSRTLPNFAKLRPVGSIYTASLDVPPQAFELGFPGVTKRFEWFAIDYTGRFWVDKAGTYQFSLLSDDGSKLYIDGELQIDNDGLHPPEEKEGSVELSQGAHRIRVSYFQGPKFHVALVLKVAGPGEESRVFSTDEFKPPRNPDKWTDEPAEPSMKRK